MRFVNDSQRRAVFARLGRSMRGAERGYIPAGYKGIQSVTVEPVIGDPLIDYGSKVIAEDKPIVSQDLTKGADFLLPYVVADDDKYKEQVTVNPYKDVSTEIDKYVAKMKAEKKPEDDIVQISDEYTFEPLKAHKGPALRMSLVADDDDSEDVIVSSNSLDVIDSLPDPSVDDFNQSILDVNKRRKYDSKKIISDYESDNLSQRIRELDIGSKVSKSCPNTSLVNTYANNYCFDGDEDVTRKYKLSDFNNAQIKRMNRFIDKYDVDFLKAHIGPGALKTIRDIRAEAKKRRL